MRGIPSISEQFLGAAELEAADPCYVENLNNAAQTLRYEFDEHFGSEALNMYYLGKIKILKYDEDDRVIKNSDGSIALKSKDFGIHVPHEKIADELKIRFINVHGVLQQYFMATALHKQTNNNVYRDIATDLFQEFTILANRHTEEDKASLTDEELQSVIASVDFTTERMIEHTIPLSLRLAGRSPETH